MQSGLETHNNGGSFIQKIVSLWSLYFIVVFDNFKALEFEKYLKSHRVEHLQKKTLVKDCVENNSIYKAPRFLFCDTNAFIWLSSKPKLENFMEKLERSEILHYKELAESLQKSLLINEPIVIVELFGLKQKEINVKINKKLILIEKDAFKILASYIKEFNGNGANSQAYVGILSFGFQKCVDFLYDCIVEHLQQENILSHEYILNQIKSSINPGKKAIIDPSSLFIHYYEFAQEILSEGPEVIIRAIALEAILRYTPNLISRHYNGQKVIKNFWGHYITHYYFALWKNQENQSAYRIINDETFIFGQKGSVSKINRLGIDDDMLDSYVTHFLAFGWFNMSNLHSIQVLTMDPFNKIYERVKQYEMFLHYAQNPPLIDGFEITKISCGLKPGSLYCVNKNNKKIEYCDFY